MDSISGSLTTTSLQQQENISPLGDGVVLSSAEIATQLKDMALEETKSSEKHLQEAVLLDFSNTFKAGTRGFKKKATKKVPPQLLEGEKPTTEVASLDVNKDLEDANFGAQSDATIEIPRNLTITQE